MIWKGGMELKYAELLEAITYINKNEVEWHWKMRSN